MVRTYRVVGEGADEEKQIEISESIIKTRRVSVYQLREEIKRIKSEITALKTRKASLIAQIREIKNANLGISIGPVPTE